MPHRRVLLLLLAAVGATTLALLAVTIGGDDDDETVTSADPTSEDAATTTTGAPTTTTDPVESSTSTTGAGGTAAESGDGSSTVPDGSAAAAAEPGSATSSPRAPRVMTAPAPPPTTTTTAAPAPPPFQASIEAVTAEQLGSSWRAGCPVGPEQLRAVNVTHWGYDGAVHQGRVIVDGAHADRVVAALRAVYDARFPIQRMEPVDRFGSDDGASMRANNTSAFNCRYVAGTTKWSEHSYGRAIDINPLHNPYVRNGSVDPPEGATWADRSRRDPGMIHPDDAVVRAFAAQGWAWGGYWSSGKDYQHFSASGR